MHGLFTADAPGSASSSATYAVGVVSSLFLVFAVPAHGLDFPLTAIPLYTTCGVQALYQSLSPLVDVWPGEITRLAVLGAGTSAAAAAWLERRTNGLRALAIMYMLVCIASEFSTRDTLVLTDPSNNLNTDALWSGNLKRVSDGVFLLPDVRQIQMTCWADVLAAYSIPQSLVAGSAVRLAAVAAVAVLPAAMFAGGSATRPRAAAAHIVLTVVAAAGGHQGFYSSASAMARVLLALLAGMFAAGARLDARPALPASLVTPAAATGPLAMAVLLTQWSGGPSMYAWYYSPVPCSSAQDMYSPAGALVALLAGAGFASVFWFSRQARTPRYTAVLAGYTLLHMNAAAHVRDARCAFAVVGLVPSTAVDALVAGAIVLPVLGFWLPQTHTRVRRAALVTNLAVAVTGLALAVDVAFTPREVMQHVLLVAFMTMFERQYGDP